MIDSFKYEYIGSNVSFLVPVEAIVGRDEGALDNVNCGTDESKISGTVADDCNRLESKRYVFMSDTIFG